VPIVAFISTSTGIPADKMRLFLDGEDPEEYHVCLYLIIAGVVLALVTLALVALATVKYVRETKKIGIVPWEQI